MKKILIPIGFSLNSYQSVDYITDLFKNENCEFYFLNTYSYDVYGLNAIAMLQAEDEWFEKPKDNSVRLLSDLLEKHALKKENAKHEFHVISEYSSLVKGIKNNINAIGIDLLVLTGKKKIGKKTEDIVDNIRTCPVLIVPPCACVYKTLNFTIASSFKEEVSSNEIKEFLKGLKNTSFLINILVLKEKKRMTVGTQKNLNLLIHHLQKYLERPISFEYFEKPKRLRNYAKSHVNNIMCIMHKKPNFLRSLGLSKSGIFSTLKKLQDNPVLTTHQ